MSLFIYIVLGLIVAVLILCGILYYTAGKIAEEIEEMRIDEDYPNYKEE